MNELASYIDRIRERTMRVAACVPPEHIEWAYMPGKFSIGDTLRHLASIERWMFAENARLAPSRYPGHGRELADGHDAVLDYMRRMHAESMEIFASLSEEALDSKCITPGGAELRVGKWLRAMIEHEAHHRGQLYLYCAMLGIATPPIFGLTEEQVRERSR